MSHLRPIPDSKKITDWLTCTETDSAYAPFDEGLWGSRVSYNKHLHWRYGQNPSNSVKGCMLPVDSRSLKKQTKLIQGDFWLYGVVSGKDESRVEHIFLWVFY